MTDDTNEPKEPDDSSTKDDMQPERPQPAPIGQPPLSLDPNDPLWWLELGAEPYWMQDIRATVRKLEAGRLASRRLRGAEPASGPDSGS